MAKRRPLTGLTSRFKFAPAQVYSRAIAVAGSTVTPTPMNMVVAAQATGGTPPVLPPPTAAAIYQLITQLQDYLITEAGDNMTTELQ